MWLFFFTLVTGRRRSLSLKLSDTGVYEPQMRARVASEFVMVVQVDLSGGLPAALSLLVDAPVEASAQLILRVVPCGL